MKKIKLRCIEQERGFFAIQRKTLFGWKYITYLACSFGGCVRIRYCEKTKKKVLKKALDGYYKTCKKYVTIIDYPTTDYGYEALPIKTL